MFLLLMACSKEEPAPVLGKDPVERIAVLEQRAAVLALWAEKGIEGSVLINVSPVDSLGYVSPGVIAHLRGLLKAREWESATEYCRTNLGPGNYLTAAISLGIVREVHWVIPFRLFDDIAMAGGKIRTFLHDSSPLSPATIAGMKMEYGSLTGPVHSGTLHVSSPRTLSKPTGPVLLMLDAGYLPAAYREQGVTNLASLRNLFEELAFRGLKIRSSAVIDGVAEGAVDPAYGYLAAEIVEGLKTPQWFRADAPPELWKLRDAADNMLAGGEDKLVVSSVEKSMGSFPADRPLRMLKAVALMRSGDVAGAIKELERLCGEDRWYAHGFVSMGDYLSGKGKNAEGAYRRAAELLPKSPTALKSLALYLRRNGRNPEAVEVAEKLARLRRGSDELLLLGDCDYMSGNADSALAAYEEGVFLLGEEKDSGIKVTKAQFLSINNMARLYRAKGDKGMGDALLSRFRVSGDSR